MSIAPFVRRFGSLTEHRDLDEKEVGDKWMKYREALMGEWSQPRYCFMTQPRAREIARILLLSSDDVYTYRERQNH